MPIPVKHHPSDIISRLEADAAVHEAYGDEGLSEAYLTVDIERAAASEIARLRERIRRLERFLREHGFNTRATQAG